MSVDWTFGGTWPYEPRFHRTERGRMHYVAVGAERRPAVVLLHGNPTWSFLYRRIIPAVVDAGWRAIAIDHLGFGRSDRLTDRSACSVEAHAERLGGLLDRLDLEQAVFVIHDWSGPVALPWVADHADRVAGLFLLNTFAPELPGPMGSRASIRAFRTPGLGSFLVKRRNVPVEAFVFKAGLAHPERLDETAKEAYRAPFATPESREPILALPRELPLREGGPVAELTQRTAARLRDRLASTPVALCWGAKDILFGDDVVALWRELLPHAEVTRIDDAGHFVQEDAPSQVSDRLVAFAEHCRSKDGRLGRRSAVEEDGES